MTDPFVGQLIFFRVYSGVLKSGDTIYNPIKDKKERIGRLLQMHANQREEIKEVRAGDIAAAVGLREATTGDTICDLDKPIILERMVFPEPVISQAVEPKTKVDQEKMGIALEPPGAGRSVVPRAHRRGVRPDDHLRHGRAAPRDPRRPHEARVRRRGHRRQAAGRLPRDDPQGGRAVEGKFVKQSGGRGQYGHVVLKLEPQTPGKGFEFVDAIKGGAVPREFIPAVEKGVRETLPDGVLAGYPVVDVKVTLFDGSYHEVDSNENAFKMAASIAFKEGMRRGEPGAARADDGGRSRDARGLHGQRDRRPVVAPRRRSRAWTTWPAAQGRSRPRCRSRRCSATRPPALADPGPRDVHDGIQALRRGAEERRRVDHQPESRSETDREE